MPFVCCPFDVADKTKKRGNDGPRDSGRLQQNCHGMTRSRTLLLSKRHTLLVSLPSRSVACGKIEIARLSDSFRLGGNRRGVGKLRRHFHRSGHLT
jgi:hypothetical protein